MQRGIRRWMTDEGTIRILVADSTDMVREAARFARTAPEITEIYGRLLTGTALLQLAQAPLYRVQCTLEHGGNAGSLLADVWPGPTVRGRVENAQATQAPLVGAEGTVHVSRQASFGGDLYRSAAPMRGGRVADALQSYMLESEQVLTLFALATVTDADGGVHRAGGLLVQALPGLTHEHLEAVTRSLEQASFEDLVRAGDEPFSAAEAIFSPLVLHHLGNDPLEYRCRCSRDKAAGAVELLGEDAVAAVRAGATETVTCEFCGTSYVIGQSDFSQTA